MPLRALFLFFSAHIQNQMVNDGKMHGFMGMYWAKKILEWTSCPIYISMTSTHVAKIKAMISWAVIAQLICAFVFRICLMTRLISNLNVFYRIRW